MSQSMLKFGLANFNNKTLLPPFVKMNEQTACKCAVGHHTVWTNYLFGQDPTCHCEPDSNTEQNCQPPSTAPNAPNGYRYYWSTEKCQWIMNVDYETVSNVKGGILMPETTIFQNTGASDLLQSAKDFFNNNKLLVLAGVAGLGYLALSGGLSASDRTVTSVTRYAPKRKNGLRKARNGKSGNRKRFYK